MTGEFSFVKELNYKKFFNDDELRIIEIVGIEKFLLLLEEFKKRSVYFSTERIEVMKREYVLKNKKTPVKELVKKTGFAEGTIYSIIRSDRSADPSLFDK